MVCGSCGPRTLTVEDMKHMTSEQIIAVYRQGYKLVQGGAPQQQAMSQEWQYGGVKSLVAPITPCATGKQSGQLVTLTSAPTGGVFPYTVRFWRGTGTPTFPFAQVGTDQLPATEGASVFQSWTLSDADVAAATGDSAAMEPIGAMASGMPTVDFAFPTPLANSAIRVLTTTVDSCPTAAGGPKSCIGWCDVTLACTPPTCNFTVV